MAHASWQSRHRRHKSAVFLLLEYYGISHATPRFVSPKTIRLTTVPVNPMPFLPYARHEIDDADIAAVVAVLRGDWLTTRPLVGRFEG